MSQDDEYTFTISFPAQVVADAIADGRLREPSDFTCATCGRVQLDDTWGGLPSFCPFCDKAAWIESGTDAVFRNGAADTDLMRVFVVRRSDGAVIEERCDFRPGDYNWNDLFWWTGGNMGCDCNRHLSFERGQGREPPRHEVRCGHDLYSVVLTGPDGFA